jgi:hypothetical protein
VVMKFRPPAGFMNSFKHSVRLSLRQRLLKLTVVRGQPKLYHYIMIRVGIILSVLFISTQVFAQEDQEDLCPDQSARDVNLPDNYMFLKGRTRGVWNNGACSVSLIKAPYLYSVNEEGKLTFGYSDTLRSYVFFPRKNPKDAAPDFKIMTTGDYEFTMMSGTKVRISPDTHKIKEISQASLVDDGLTKNKKIGKAEFLILDMGTRIETGPGARKVAVLERDKNHNATKVKYAYFKSKFIDANGNQCEVADNLIIDYPKDRIENTEGRLKFGKELYNVVSKLPHCKKVDFSSLLLEGQQTSFTSTGVPAPLNIQAK